VSDWPDDADGDVFRRLEESGLNFDSPVQIDFNIDFSNWPPAQEALQVLADRYSAISVVEPVEDFTGYVEFQLFERPTYERVMAIQAEVSGLMARFGGVCESWGILAAGAQA
jgi:hypothetical protein